MENKTKRGRKTNEIQAAERFQTAFEYIVYRRLSYTEFKETFSKEMKITQRQAEVIYKQVKETLKNRFKDEQEEILETQITRYQDLLIRARDSGNRRIEREVLSDLNKLYGIESPTKVDLTSGGDPISLNIILDKD
jgi:arginine utilization protein RocB